MVRSFARGQSASWRITRFAGYRKTVTVTSCTYFLLTDHMADQNRLLSKIRTRAEAQKLRSEIEKLLASLYEGETAFVSCMKEIRSWVAQELKAYLPEDRELRKKYLEELVQRIEQFEPLELTLAFEPGEETLATIFSYIQQATGPGVILDLRLDPKILGGARIAFRGLYRDFSLIQQFDLEFAKLTLLKTTRG